MGTYNSLSTFTKRPRSIFPKETRINELTLLVLDNAVGPGKLWLKSCELYILVETVWHLSVKRLRQLQSRLKKDKALFRDYDHIIREQDTTRL